MRKVILILALVAIAIGVIFWIRKASTPKLEVIPTPSTEEKIEESFMIEIPEDMEKVALVDVSGGDGTGIATRKFEGGKFSHMVLADLPNPQAGAFYEGWLVRGKEGESNFTYISTGKMRVAKGGYILEFESKTDYSAYGGVVITLEKFDDRNPEIHILEGSF